MFPRLSGSSDRIAPTTAGGGGITVPAADRSPVSNTASNNDDLQKFVGLFGSRKPFAQVRVFVDGGSLKATMLNEPSQPSYVLRPLSVNRFHFEGTPAGFDIAFEVDGSRVRRAITYRPGYGNVTLDRER
jgi:hypothetical protein